MGHIYYILCKFNNKIYIGSTARNNYRLRFNEHKYKLKNNKHGNKHLQNSWNLYGSVNFEFGLLDSCSKEKVFLLEWHYVSITGSYDKNIGYNRSKVIECPVRGIKLSEERKANISRKLKGRVSPRKGKENPKAYMAYEKANEVRKKKVINLCTMEVFDSVKEFTKEHNINNKSFHKHVGRSYFKEFYFDYYDPDKEYINLPVRFNYKKGKGCLEGLKKARKSKMKKVICIETGVTYNSIAEAAKMNKLNRRSLNDSLLNNRPHKNLNWRYVEC